MTDFVRILQEYATDRGWHYSYGRKANLNLLAPTTNLDDEKIYLLHEPAPRKPEPNSTGTGIKSYMFTGHFFLLVKSELDMPYFNEMNNPEARSKYVLYIQPLLLLWEQMSASFLCLGYELLNFEAIDAVNLFDEGRDGLLITYQIRITN